MRLADDINVLNPLHRISGGFI
jgi:hypothetical protein